MPNLDDVITKAQALSDVEDGAGLIYDQLIAQDTDVATRLRAALAAGADPAKVQAVLDVLDANIAKSNTKRQQALDAITANTVAA